MSSRHLPKLLETNLDALIPRSRWNTIMRNGNIRDEYAVPFVRLFHELHAIEGKSQQWLLQRLRDEGVFAAAQEKQRTAPKDHYNYRRLVYDEWMARSREEIAAEQARQTLQFEQQKFDALTEALLDLHKLSLTETERHEALVRCVVKGLGYSGIRGYEVDLQQGPWFEFLSHGEQVASRFADKPALPGQKEAKSFIMRLMRHEITPEKIREDESSGLYSWHVSANWSLLHIPDRSQSYFVDGQRIEIDRQAYKTQDVLEMMFLVLGDIKSTGRVKVYQITNWAKGAPLFTNMESDLRLLNILAEELAVVEANTALKTKIEMLSRTDAKTGLWNMRYFKERLIKDLQLAKRLKQPLSILMIDIDNLTTHNTKYGHPFADLIIKAVAAAIQDVVREIDTVVRYGGDEILVILLGADSQGAEALAVGKRICAAVRKLEMMWGREKVAVSVSIGAANSSAEEAKELLDIALGLKEQRQLEQFPLVQQADQALYEAKKAGRDQVSLYKS